MSKPETIRIDETEYVRKDSIQPVLSLEENRRDNPNWPWVLGRRYMIRTVTFHDHGELVGVTDQELVLRKAAWIADSGRWWNFITGKAKPNEVEPFHPDRLVIIGRGSVIDACQLDELFGDQK
jgi:hypothetical protein